MNNLNPSFSQNGFQKGSGICLSEQSRGINTFENNFLGAENFSQESVNQYLRNNFESTNEVIFHRNNNLNQYVNLAEHHFSEDERRSKSAAGYRHPDDFSGTQTTYERPKSANKAKIIDLKKCKDFFQKDRKLVENQLQLACEIIQKYKGHMEYLNGQNVNLDNQIKDLQSENQALRYENQQIINDKIMLQISKVRIQNVLSKLQNIQNVDPNWSLKLSQHHDNILKNLNELMQFYGCNHEGFITLPSEQYMLAEYKLQQAEQIQIEFYEFFTKSQQREIESQVSKFENLKKYDLEQYNFLTVKHQEAVEKYQALIQKIQDRLKELTMKLTDVEKSKEKQMKLAKRDMKLKIREILHESKSDVEKLLNQKENAMRECKKALEQLLNSERSNQQLQNDNADMQDQIQGLQDVLSKQDAFITQQQQQIIRMTHQLNNLNQQRFKSQDLDRESVPVVQESSQFMANDRASGDHQRVLTTDYNKFTKDFISWREHAYTDEPIFKPKIINNNNVHNRYKSAISGVSELSQVVPKQEPEKPQLNMVFSSTESVDEELESFLSKEKKLNLQQNVYVDNISLSKTTPKFDLVAQNQYKRPTIFINDQNPNDNSNLSFNFNNSSQNVIQQQSNIQSHSATKNIMNHSVEKRISRLSDYTMTLTNQLMKVNKMTSPKHDCGQKSNERTKSNTSENLEGSQNVRAFLNNIPKKKKQKSKSKGGNHTMLVCKNIVTSPTDENQDILQKIKSEICSIDGEISELQQNLASKIPHSPPENGRNHHMFSHLTTSQEDY